MRRTAEHGRGRAPLGTDDVLLIACALEREARRSRTAPACTQGRTCTALFCGSRGAVIDVAALAWSEAATMLAFRSEQLARNGG